MKNYLLNTSNVYQTNQKFMGWDQAFRGHVMKAWNNNCTDWFFNCELSRKVVKLCASHYIEY